MKNTIPIFLLILLAGQLFAQNADKNPVLETPFAIQANGEDISVNTGHSAPLIYDFNEDGVQDLLVGEFGIIPCQEARYRDYVEGRCRIYINHGTDSKPVYTDYQWLEAGGKPAFVPITCCISFVPRFADLNNDGIDDLISGSATGEIFLWKGLGNQKFQKGIILKDSEGNVINPAHSCSAVPVDWDNDGDWDLLINSRLEGSFLVENKGTRNDYRFAPAKGLTLESYSHGDIPSYLGCHDWDGDGLFDLVGGTENYEIVWTRNTGTPGHPSFGKFETLWNNPQDPAHPGNTPTHPLGYRVKTWVYDYNHDGKPDIIAGDVNTDITYLKKDYSKDEQKAVMCMQKRMKVENKFYKKHPDFLKRLNKRENMDNYPGYAELKVKMHKIDLKREAIENGYRTSKTTGRVWVFLRK